MLAQFQALVSDVIRNRTELGCPTPCATHEYRLTKSNLGTNTNVRRFVLNEMEQLLSICQELIILSLIDREDSWYSSINICSGKMSLYPFYNLPSIKIEEEYTLMDAAAMITATGGSLRDNILI